MKKSFEAFIFSFLQKASKAQAQKGKRDEEKKQQEK